MNKSAVKYAAEFQWIAALMNWDDDALVLQYYWELNKTIKDEIVRMNWPEELQNMINIFININSHQWKQQMKHTEHYIKSVKRHYILRRGALWTSTQLRSTVSSNHKWSKNGAWASSISLNFDEQRLTNVITVKSSNTCKNLQKPQWERKVAAMNTCIVHNALSWTVCYDNMCWTHMSSKDKANDTHRNSRRNKTVTTQQVNQRN
jgi:hypothetical protein